MKLYTLGEVLIDFTPVATDHSSMPVFEQNPGGAPANVAVMAAKLGTDAHMIAKVGDDLFGTFLTNYLTGANVGIAHITKTKDAMTPLAFVSIDEDGDRDFAFYRNPGADTKLTKSDLADVQFDTHTILHVGSVSLTDEPSRSATIHALEQARLKGSIISFDPNIRLSLWADHDILREELMRVFSYADVVKLSEEEVSFLALSEDEETSCRLLAETFNIPLIIVTRGEKGCSAFRNGHFEHVPGYPVRAVDTTGAGDAFWGALLAGVCQTLQNVQEIETFNLTDILKEANAAGSLTVTKRGGIPALPDKEDIHQLVVMKSGQ